MTNNSTQTQGYTEINSIPVFPKKVIESKFRFRDGFYMMIWMLVFVGLTYKLDKAINPGQYRDASLNASAKETKLQQAQIIPIPTVDNRTAKLEAFLKAKESPLTEHAGYIVKVSDENGIDYTLIVSISGRESGYGKNARCFNAWGLGGEHSFMCFESWEESISYAGRLLGKNYRHNIAKGIQEKYCPTEECDKDWADFVVSASQEILAINVK